MLVFFDIKFIRRDQKQRKIGEACRANPTGFWSSRKNLITKTLPWFSIHHELLADLKQMKSRQIYSNLLASRLRYGVNRLCHSTNRNIVIMVNVRISQFPSEIASERITW